MKEHRNVESLTDEELVTYEQYLRGGERSQATVKKYPRDVRKFRDYICEGGSGGFDRGLVLEYKQCLNRNYKTTSMSSALAAVNGFFDYPGCEEYKVRLFKVQRIQFSEKEKELTEKDYKRLVYIAKRKDNIRMSMLLQTIGDTGIRISELQFITVEAPERGWAEIYNKGKPRMTLLPAELVKALKRYRRRVGIKSGDIFITRNGKLMDRSNISKQMEIPGKEIGADTAKVLPYNLRHLSTEVFCSIERDMIRLVDLLGHSNIGTIRIYTMGTGEQPRRQMSQIRMVLN